MASDAPKLLLPYARPMTECCIVCGHPISTTTIQAMAEAVQDHILFINDTKDRSVDPHFADLRIDALLA